MKAKLLKKIRRRFEWERTVTLFHNLSGFLILDRKTGRLHRASGDTDLRSTLILLVAGERLADRYRARVAWRMNLWAYTPPPPPKSCDPHFFVPVSPSPTLEEARAALDELKMKPGRAYSSALHLLERLGVMAVKLHDGSADADDMLFHLRALQHILAAKKEAWM